MESYTLSTSVLLCAAVVLLLLEWHSPWRRAAAAVKHRWLTNLGLMLAGGIVVGAVFPTGVMEVAADMHGGWIQQWQLPLVLEGLLVFLLLDAWRYWEHRVLHEVHLLWRVHLVHHSDTSLDITTGQRHHPLEAIVATCTALLLVFALGFSVQALAIYLAIASLSALWTHANIDLPESIDRPLRLWLVTPAVHAIHHSDLQRETDSNYGSVLTLWDRLFGTYTDPATARIPHFGLEYFHRPEDTALAPVLLQPFDYRRGMAYPPRTAIDRAPLTAATTLSSEWQRALWQLLAGLSLALFALWPTALNLATVWSSSDPYQYAWLVLPMFVYCMGWYHREWLLAMTPRPDALGLALIGCAIAGWIAAYVVDIQLGQQLALVLVLQGLALCTLGRTVYRRTFPIMALLFMMVPCGDILQPLLRELTVKWIEWFALLLNLPHTVDGFMVYVGEHRYVVVEACSGLTFVTLAGFLGYSFGLLLFRSFGKILALAALGATLGVLTNALRVWLIVGIDWLQDSQMDMAAHMDLQWLALLSALSLLFFLIARLARHGDPVDSSTPGSGNAPQWRATGFAPVLAGLLVLLVITPVQRLAAQGANNDDHRLQTLADFYPQSSWINADQASGRALLIPYRERLDIVIAEPRASHARVDESRLSPGDDSVWRHAATAHYSDCSGADCTRFVHKTWRRKGSDDARHALYVYYVGARVTDSELTYRLASGWNRISGAGASSGLFGFRIRGELPAEQVLAQALAQFMDESRAAQTGSMPVAANTARNPGMAAMQPVP